MKRKFIGNIFKRIFSALVTLFILISFLFIIIRVSPGNPAQKYLSPEFSPQLSKLVMQKFNLDQPLLNQYATFVKNIFTGDFGISYSYHLPVISVVWDSLSFTLVFASLSFIIELILSFLLAVYVARKEKIWLDKLISNISLAIYSTPSFVLGVILILIFSIKLDIFPTSGLKSFDYDSYNFFEKFGNLFVHLVLPLITLSAAGVAVFYKYVRDNLREVKNQPFIMQLKASGYKDSEILLKHIIPNAIRPLISVAGIELGILLGGALITEVIFGLPGMGRLTIDSIVSRDYPLIIACAFTAGALMILTNLIADIIKIKINPGIKRENII
jgi:peptide/nickel transport system permease protein